MTTIKSGRWGKIRRLLLALLIVALVAALGYLIYTGFTHGWPAWTGFGPYTPPQPPIEGYQREKTLWDWLQLLVVPLVLAIAAFFLNRTERINAERAAEQRTKTEREIAEKRTQEDVLETYLDCMADLLFDQKLLKSQPGDEVRQMARIRTLTALRRLDGDRNQVLIRFLSDAGLSNKSDPIIDMCDADLRGVNLEGANLEGADLRWADLTGADLRAALTGADLSGAFLEGANLYGAFLERADLRKAKLQGADLRRAWLREANLEGADLEGADLEGANLQGATMPDGSKYE